MIRNRSTRVHGNKIFIFVAIATVPLAFLVIISLVVATLVSGPYRDAILGGLWTSSVAWCFFLGLYSVGVFAFYAVCRAIAWLAMQVSQPSLNALDTSSSGKKLDLEDASDREYAILSLIESIQACIELGQSCEAELLLLEVLSGRDKILLEQVAKPRTPDEVLNELINNDV